MCEIERIWIIYDKDNNGKIDFDELVIYLKERAYPHLDLSMDQLESIMTSMDKDGNGTIDKKEMN